MRTVLLALACVASLLAPVAALEGPRYQVTLHPVSGWVKICSKAAAGLTCYTSRHFGTDQKRPPILDLSVSALAGGGRVARFLVPTGLRTDRGLTFSVDGGERQPGRFEACIPNGCFAEASFGIAVLAAMKKGGTMQITTTDAKNRRVDFWLSLDGFAAAYNGAAIAARPIAPPRAGTPQTPPMPQAGGANI